MIYAQLRAFHALAVEGNFTKAAQRLKISQPAVSKRLKELEDSYDVTLCSRHGGQISLTDHGEHLFNITTKMFRLEEEADNLLRSAKSMEPSRFRIGTDAPYSLSNVMLRYRERHPNLPVTLTLNTAEEMRRHLLTCAVDIAILIRLEPDPRLLMVPFEKHAIAAIVPIDHPLSEREAISLRELAAYPMVMRLPTLSLTSRLFQDALDGAGLEPTVALSVDSREAMKEAVGAGIGVGVLAEGEARADRRLKTVPLIDTDMVLQVYVVCLKERRKLKAIDSFLQIAREISEAKAAA